MFLIIFSFIKLYICKKNSKIIVKNTCLKFLYNILSLFLIIDNFLSLFERGLLKL